VIAIVYFILSISVETVMFVGLLVKMKPETDSLN